MDRKMDMGMMKSKKASAVMDGVHKTTKYTEGKPSKKMSSGKGDKLSHMVTGTRVTSKHTTKK